MTEEEKYRETICRIYDRRINKKDRRRYNRSEKQCFEVGFIGALLLSVTLGFILIYAL